MKRGKQNPIWKDKRLKRIKATYESVKNIAKAYKFQAKYYNLRRRRNSLQVGQQVLCRRHTLSNATKGIAWKLTPKLEGPYTITGKEEQNIILIENDHGE